MLTTIVDKNTGSVYHVRTELTPLGIKIHVLDNGIETISYVFFKKSEKRYHVRLRKEALVNGHKVINLKPKLEKEDANSN